jgi:nitroreductase
MNRMIEDLIKENRTCRRFYQDFAIDVDLLKHLVNLARLSASAANRQPLRYAISCDARLNEQIYPCLAWAGYLKDWPGPEKGERPSAYIVILGDTSIADNFWCDHGIASQSILLGAREQGLAGCMIGAINKEKLREVLNIPKQYKMLLVLAIGIPKEQVTIEKVKEDGDIKYWRDEKGMHHVPKRRLEDIIVDFL